MRIQRLVRVLSVALVAALAAVACGGSGDSGGSGDAGSGDAAPQDGGVMTVLVDQDGPTSLDPATSLVHSTLGSLPMSAVFDLLVYIDPESGQVENLMAESLEPNEDGSVWTLRLHEGIRFSDGTPYDAAAIHAEMQRLADPDVHAAALPAAQAVTTTVVDDLTIEYRPREPDLNYAHVIALNFSMIPSPTAVAADPEGFGQAPVGAGPYVLADWVVGETKTFERNPDYWQEGKPHLDGFETIAVTDPQQSVNRLQSGEADLISVQQIQHLQLGRDAGLELETGGPLNGGFVWLFNHEVPPFDDVRARRVFQLAVDSQGLNDLLFQDLEAPVNLFAPDSPFHDASTDFPDPDMEEAQEIADEIAAEGDPLEFEITTWNDQTAQAYAEFAQQALSSLDGVEVTVQAYEGGDWLSRTRGGEYSVGFYTGWWSAPYPVFHQITATDGPLNYGNYSNPEVDELLQQAVRTADPDEQHELYGEITRIMTEDVAFVPFAFAEVGFMHDGGVGGLTGVHLGNTPLWGDVYLTEGG